MKILFLTPYPFNTAPSQRFRFEQYFESLRKQGIFINQFSFYSQRNWKVIYSDGNYLHKAFLIIISCLTRFIHLLKCLRYDLIFLHREAASVGPPFFEWVIASVFRKRIIYDFDDAIWLTDVEHRKRINKKIRWQNKTGTICRLSYKVSCGNEYLRQYALNYNPRSILNPTTVDTTHMHNQLHRVQNGKVVIGWTGTHSNLKYLYGLTEVLEKAIGMGKVSVLIICNRRPEWTISDFQFIQWNPDREIEDLLKIDIGLMPLPDDEWTRGKCGFKAIQYMALGIPALVSPLEVNRQIVDHGLNGYHCSEPGEWLKFIMELSEDPVRRIEFGRNGREKIIKNYSTASNLTNFLRLFE